MAVHAKVRTVFVLGVFSITVLSLFLFNHGILKGSSPVVKANETLLETKELLQDSISVNQNLTMEQESVSVNRSLMMEIRLQERKARVQDYCKRHNRNADTVLGKDLHYFVAFRSRKVIYCFIPKVASTQWKEELSGLREEEKKIYQGDLKEHLGKFPRQEVEQIIKNYFTFLFVRDPMERVLSAYKDKFIKPNWYFHPRYGRDIIKRYRPNATQEALKTGDGVTFPEFTKYWVETRISDEHWASFDKLCHPCAVNYDFIGRFEDLGEDARHLVKKAGIDDLVSSQSFRSSNTTADMLHYYSQIPKQRISQLAKIYESDYEMFGYSFPGQLGALFNSPDN